MRDRVLAVLAELARHPDGVGLDEIARAVGEPQAHRAPRARRRCAAPGFAVQDGRGRYVLGDEFLRLAFAHHEARPDHVRVAPVLQDAGRAVRRDRALRRARRTTTVVYRAKVDPPRGALRLTSVVGGRNPAHARRSASCCSSYALPDDAAVADWVGGRDRWSGVPTRTLTTADALHRGARAGSARGLRASTTRRTSPASTASPYPRS